MDDDDEQQQTHIYDTLASLVWYLFYLGMLDFALYARLHMDFLAAVFLSAVGAALIVKE